MRASFSAKTKKHLIEGLTSLGLMSNSKFMARLSDWMGAVAGLGGMAGFSLWIRHWYEWYITVSEVTVYH